MRQPSAVFQTFQGSSAKFAVEPRPAAGHSEAKKPLSALEIGVDHLGHIIDRQGTWVRRPIDEESGR